MNMHVTGHVFEHNRNAHMEVLGEILETSIVWAPTDIMKRKKQHDLPFEVSLPTRECWENGGPDRDPNALYYYTDGSKTSEGVGLGVYGNGVDRSISLGRTLTIFQTEVMAITTCAEMVIRHTGDRNEVYIVSDSQAAIKALSSTNITSNTVWECLRALRRLARQRKVHITWIPGHRGHEGNERADGLAQRGAGKPYMGPEPACGFPKSLTSSELRDWERRKNYSYWNSLQGLRQSKRLMGHGTNQFGELGTRNRSQMRTLTVLLTGHGRLNYHLKKIGLTQDDTCRLCQEDTESSEHVLCECEALAITRLLSFSKPFLKAEEVCQLDPDDLLRFARISGLDWI
jgi:ribonuclease HI